MKAKQTKVGRKRYPFKLTFLTLVASTFAYLFHYSYTLFALTLAAILTTIGLWYIVKSSRIATPYLSAELLNVDQMNDEQFHHLLMPVFSRQNYSVTTIKGKQQGTATLLLRKKGIKASVYLVRGNDDIDTDTIQRAINEKQRYQATRSIIVTNRHFTNEAIKLARANKITLIDRESLDAMLDVYLRQKRSHRFIHRVRTLFIQEDMKSS